MQQFKWCCVVTRPYTFVRRVCSASNDESMCLSLLNSTNNAQVYNDFKHALLAEGWQAKVKVTLIPPQSSPRGGVFHELCIGEGRKRM